MLSAAAFPNFSSIKFKKGLWLWYLSKASSLNVVEWDSLAYLTKISKIEKTFKIKINQKNINNFGSVENIVKEIKKCKKK